MISRDTFITVLQLIREQEEINDKVEAVLDLVGDGHFVYGVKNKLHQATMLLLKEDCNDRYDYIDWWLYESTDHVVSDDTKEWHLDTPDDLYDFLVENQELWLNDK